MRPASGIAWLLAVALTGSATAQSLGEAAAKEKKRREALKAAAEAKARGKSYSDADVPKSDPAVDGSASDASDEYRPVPGDEGKRARAAEIKKTLGECHANLAAARTAAKAAEEAPELTPRPSDDPFNEEPPAEPPPAEEPPEGEAAPADTPPPPPLTRQQKVVEAKALVARTAQQCEDIEDSARKAGIPPGWIR